MPVVPNCSLRFEVIIAAYVILTAKSEGVLKLRLKLPACGRPTFSAFSFAGVVSGGGDATIIPYESCAI